MRACVQATPTTGPSFASAMGAFELESLRAAEAPDVLGARGHRAAAPGSAALRPPIVAAERPALAGTGPSADAAAALPPPSCSDEPCWAPGRLVSAVRHTVASAGAAVAQARHAYWGLGCLVGAPLHLARVLHHMAPPSCKPVRHNRWLLAEALLGRCISHHMRQMSGHLMSTS